MVELNQYFMVHILVYCYPYSKAFMVAQRWQQKEKVQYRILKVSSTELYLYQDVKALSNLTSVELYTKN